MAGNDAGLLVVAGSVAGKLGNLGSEVLEHGTAAAESLKVAETRKNV